MLLALSLLASGCATTLEASNRDELRAKERELDRPQSRRGRAPAARLDGSLDGYVRYALAQSPSLRASFEEWRAATHRVPQARRLPEPVFTYGYFVRRVETRVGPQRHRFGIRQAFPWPTKLSAGADAASLAARSARHRFDSEAVMLSRRVATAYWKIWVIRRSREVQRDQLEILKHFSSVVRTRVEIGQASLADLGQVDLTVSRVTDSLAALDEKERSAKARLLAVIGAPPSTKVPIRDDPPRLLEPVESETALRDAAREHPRVRALSTMANAKRESARSAGAERYPGFTLGVDYIETGEASVPNVPDSGKDPIIVMLSVKVPLWGGIYDSKESEARSQGAALEAKAHAASDEATGALEVALSDVRDATRRIRLYRDTLVPQAETVYSSVLGGYASAESTLPAVLMAQRDLLELQLSLFVAQADYATAWARLEDVLGRPVRAREVS